MERVLAGFQVTPATVVWSSPFLSCQQTLDPILPLATANWA